MKAGNGVPPLTFQNSSRIASQRPAINSPIVFVEVGAEPYIGTSRVVCLEIG